MSWASRTPALVAYPQLVLNPVCITFYSVTHSYTVKNPALILSWFFPFFSVLFLLTFWMSLSISPSAFLTSRYPCPCTPRHLHLHEFVCCPLSAPNFPFLLSFKQFSILLAQPVIHSSSLSPHKAAFQVTQLSCRVVNSSN